VLLVVISMSLSAAAAVAAASCTQVNHILACAELYFSCRAKLQNEQRLLQQHLKATAASTEGMLLSGAAWPGMCAVATVCDGPKSAI
jgi:hypothetical protein